MDKTLHQPLGGNEMPRFGGIATMLRLPHLQSAEGWMLPSLAYRWISVPRYAPAPASARGRSAPNR